MLTGRAGAAHTVAAKPERRVLEWGRSRSRREVGAEGEAAVVRLCSLLERIFEHGIVKARPLAATPTSPPAPASLASPAAAATVTVSGPASDSPTAEVVVVAAEGACAWERRLCMCVRMHAG
jgi:hypothetical protein